VCSLLPLEVPVTAQPVSLKELSQEVIDKLLFFETRIPVSGINLLEDFLIFERFGIKGLPRNSRQADAHGVRNVKIFP
jgi:hypothetical protein